MMNRVRRLGKQILARLPIGIQHRYYDFRVSQASIRAFLSQPHAAEYIAILPIRPRIIVDIGANHGDWTWSLLRILGDDTEFHLFEPTPELYEKLRRRFTDYSNVHIHALAVSDRQGIAKFHIANEDTLSSLERLDTKAFPSSVTTILTEVQTDTLDHIHATILNNANIDLLKIDTQGHEETIIAAARKTLAHTHALQVEWSVIPIYENGTDFISLHKTIVNNGLVLGCILSQQRWGHQLSWGDALYVNSRYRDGGSLK